MRVIEAVNMSVWASAYHPSGRGVSANEPEHTRVFEVSIPHIERSLEFPGESSLIEALQELGIDDDAWTPEGPEGLYDVINLEDCE